MGHGRTGTGSGAAAETAAPHRPAPPIGRRPHDVTGAARGSREPHRGAPCACAGPGRERRAGDAITWSESRGGAHAPPPFPVSLPFPPRAARWERVPMATPSPWQRRAGACTATASGTRRHHEPPVAPSGTPGRHSKGRAEHRAAPSCGYPSSGGRRDPSEVGPAALPPPALQPRADRSPGGVRRSSGGPRRMQKERGGMGGAPSAWATGPGVSCSSSTQPCSPSAAAQLSPQLPPSPRDSRAPHGHRSHPPAAPLGAAFRIGTLQCLLRSAFYIGIRLQL